MPKWKNRSYGNTLRKDETRCFYCDKPFKQQGYTIDHILPKSKGGILSNSNKVFCCRKCNAFKADKTIKEWMDSIQKAIKHVSFLIADYKRNKQKDFVKKEIQKEQLNALHSYRGYLLRIINTLILMEDGRKHPKH